MDPDREVTEEIKRWAEGLNQKGAYTLFRDQAKRRHHSKGNRL